MKIVLLFTNLLIFPGLLTAQPDFGNSQDGNLSGKEFYTVAGFRHGVSFFQKIRYAEVQDEASGTLEFDRYHSLDVIYSWLEKWALEYPDIIDLYEVGKSFEGRPVKQITLTNKKTGKDTNKPAAFFEGGRHSGEVTASECVMWIKATGARYGLLITMMTGLWMRTLPKI